MKLLFLFFAVLVCAWVPQYAPNRTICPLNKKHMLRRDDSLNSDEVSWMKSRQAKTQPELIRFLKRSGLDFNVESLLAHAKNKITIGHAFGGSSYRGLLSGAGIVSAMDARNPQAMKKGGLGGLLQTSSYLTASSGGSWLVSSLYFNNFTTVEHLLKDNRVWNFEEMIPGEPFEKIRHLTDMLQDIQTKSNAGYPVTVTDLWSRILAFQTLASDSPLSGFEWSDMRNWPWFKDHAAPYPILVSDALKDYFNREGVMEGAALMETTPFDLGSFDLGAWFPVDYLGTKVDNGVVRQGSKCKRGFDSATYMAAVSSTGFNKMIYQAFQGWYAPWRRMVRNFFKRFTSDAGLDVAKIAPNPFANMNNTDSPIAKKSSLLLVDGSQDGQGIPLQPLLEKQRNVDVIFAYDFTSDTDYNWPSGKSLLATRQKSANKHFDFVPVPGSASTFINHGLTNQPTFFGCNQKQSPLVVYMPNHPYSAYTNVSSFSYQYSRRSVLRIIENGYDLATQLNGTRKGHEDWATCIACAVLQREIRRQNKRNSKKCQSCLTKYCWDGKEDESNPKKSPNYDPKLIKGNDNPPDHPPPPKEYDPTDGGPDQEDVLDQEEERKVDVDDATYSENDPTDGGPDTPGLNLLS